MTAHLLLLYLTEADGFAGVYPEHKYDIVKNLQRLGHLVAMSKLNSSTFFRPMLIPSFIVAGDGANDAPAVSLQAFFSFFHPCSEGASFRHSLLVPMSESRLRVPPMLLEALETSY